MKTVEIFTDGACSGNPGPGGWGAILRYDGKEKRLSGGDASTTNNRMELAGVIEALRQLREPCEVVLTSDSRYVCDAIAKGWAKNWQKHGWIKSDRKPALNSDLWEILLNLLNVHHVSIRWVKGHAGHPENELCDRMAVAEAEKQKDGKNGSAERRIVYADNAATTPVSPSVLKIMLPYFSQEFGNPSSLYALGRRAKKAVESARETVAECLNARPEEIFFTSGGSESDNWAIKMAAAMGKKNGKNHFVTSEFEHHAVLHALKSLESDGCSVTALPVHENGIVRPEELKAALRPETALVSVMTANNEIGTIQPIAEIGAVCRRFGVPFHTDAVQAAGILPIDVQALNIDLLSLSAHKFHGPKGAGALFIRRGFHLPGLIDGGAQERGLRAGTENVAGIVGLAAALKEFCAQREKISARLIAMRDRLIQETLHIPGARLNGDPARRLPGNVNLSFEGVDSEALLLMLDQHGICASAGSACAAGSLEPSHVLQAIGLSPKLARSSLRLTFSSQNTEEDVDEILNVLPDAIQKARSLS